MTAFCLEHGDYKLTVEKSQQYSNADDTAPDVYAITNTVTGVREWEGYIINYALQNLKDISDAWDARHQVISSLKQVKTGDIIKLGGKGDVHH